MFQQYQYAILSTNFNCFAYLLMHSTHSSSVSHWSSVFVGFQILFVFNLLSMSFVLFQQLLVSGYVQKFQHFQLLFFSSSFSSIFYAFATTHIEQMKVLGYNQMVNAKVLMMPNCKQLNIWLSLTRGMQLARKHIIACR